MVITCGIYPAAVWAIGQLAFQHQANGSLLERNGRIVGSELIGQNASESWHFHPRPSAAGSDGYDGTSSGGSNLGPTSQKLNDRIAESVKSYRQEHPSGSIPADAVTASGSGLDPHISPDYALAQVPRVAAASGIAARDLEQLVQTHTEGRFLGIYGEARVNVLLLNLAVDAKRRR